VLMQKNVDRHSRWPCAPGVRTQDIEGVARSPSALTRHAVADSLRWAREVKDQPGRSLVEMALLSDRFSSRMYPLSENTRLTLAKIPTENAKDG
jgi:hypothetical protein